jgi:adenylate kinase family enzyme
MEACVKRGDLLPDALILRVIREHFMRAHSEGTDRFLLDGFPRTLQQAEALDQIADVQLALNLGLREEVRAPLVRPWHTWGTGSWSGGLRLLPLHRVQQV